MKNIVTSNPFELVSIDALHLGQSLGVYQYIIVFMDHFTRFAQACAKYENAKAVAKDFIRRFGFPTHLNHDRGTCFENKLLRCLEKLFEIKHSRAILYHPQGNGQVKRFN